MGPRSITFFGHQTQALKGCPLFGLHAPTGFGEAVDVAQGSQGMIHLLSSVVAQLM